MLDSRCCDCPAVRVCCNHPVQAGTVIEAAPIAVLTVSAATVRVPACGAACRRPGCAVWSVAVGWLAWFVDGFCGDAVAVHCCSGACRLGQRLDVFALRSAGCERCLLKD